MESLRPDDPRRIGEYILQGRLGAGGMGEVFLGQSPGGKAVAVKLINPLYTTHHEFRRRFRDEVAAARRVSGAYTAPVVDADPDADRPWMVTVYVAGPSLRQVLAEYPSLPPDSVRVLGAGLAEALKAIHGAGVIHRDLKPSNIVLAYDGPRVIDFGIARPVDAPAHTTQPGTAGYIAPEVLRGEPPTWACDVFSLGVVLAVASGISPFGEFEGEALNYQVVQSEPDVLGLGPQIRGLVKQCLAKTPTDRPTPEQILERLGGHGSFARWLPAPVLDLIPGYAPPPPGPPGPGLQRDSLLLEAEQAARAVADAYARAEAQVYVAAVVSRSDPDHALRLLDEALRPTQRDGMALSREHMLRHLAGHAAFELGTVLTSTDTPATGQMLDEIEGIIRSMAREEPGTVADVATRLAEAVASTDPVRAGRIARISPDQGVQASAVARAARVVARADTALAVQMAQAIPRLTRPNPIAEPAKRPPVRWWPSPRKAPPSVPMPAVRPQDSMRLWAVRALTEVAFAVTSAGSPEPTRPPSGAEEESTVSTPGDLGAPLPASARPADPIRVEQLLADAEQLARGIAADDTRALAETVVTIAVSRIHPGRAGRSLTDAEQFARTCSNSSTRDEALGEVALAAALTEPARAENIARSLADREDTVAQVASVIAATDPARAERIADVIADQYVRALVMAEIAVLTDPAHAEPRLRQALHAAHQNPARIVEVAVVAARTSPAWAEQIVRGIRSRDNVRTADFWRARALAELVSMSDQTHTLDEAAGL